MKNLSLLVVFAVLAFSCQNEKISPSDVGSEGSIQLTERSNNGNAPEQSGYIVTRGEDLIALLVIDFQAGLTLAVGLDLADYCDPFPNFDAFQLIPTQQVDIPNDPLRFQLLQRGETYFEVYDGVIDNFLCDWIEYTPLLAGGMARVVQTDNDLVSYLRDPKNHNAYGFSAKGTLTDQNGNPVGFKANYRAVYDGDDPDDPASYKEVSNIRLR